MFRCKKRRTFVLIIVSCLLLTGCKWFSNSKTPQEDFKTFTNRIFKTEVKQNTLTLNFSLADPKAYGITDVPVTLGDYSTSQMIQSLMNSENYLKTLQTYNYDSLTEEEKLTYDILEKELSQDLNSGDYLLYMESLGPTTGIQAQLPILLAEYNFYSKEDIETYLNLLPTVSDYFKQIIEFEKEKSDAGLFMSDRVADNIIKQCEDFISKKEDNYLIEVFNDTIDKYEGLTKQEKTAYKEANKHEVLHSIIPAYQLLINELSLLKGTGTNNGGLGNYEKGKEYYEYLIQSNTGTDKTVPELKEMLESSITSNLLTLSTIMAKDPSVYDRALNPKYPSSNPEDILEHLKIAIQKDFPKAPDVNYSIKYVHNSLQDHLSPAMYLIPALDNYKENIIYINNNPNYNMAQIFPTIAHEGYPGHLLQSVYFRDQQPAPIRSLLSFGGYVEGWATYVEHLSYSLAGFDDNLSEFLQANASANMALYCRLDIGIHYDTWSLTDTAKYLKQFGITDLTTVETLYTTMIEEPALYPQYGIGFLEIMELKQKAQLALGKNFDLKEFHTFFLDIGPAQFSVIEKRMDNFLLTAAKK